MITDRIKKPEEREDAAAAVAVAAVVVAAAVAVAVVVAAAAVVVAAAAAAVAVAVAVAAETKTGKILCFLFAWLYISIYLILTSQAIPLLAIGITILAVGEVIFYFEKVKPNKNDSRFWFTAKRKLGCLGESTLIVVSAAGLITLIPNLIESIGANQEAILHWLGVIGVWVIILAGIGAAIYAYIWMNSMKYRKVKK